MHQNTIDPKTSESGYRPYMHPVKAPLARLMPLSTPGHFRLVLDLHDVLHALTQNYVSDRRPQQLDQEAAVARLVADRSLRHRQRVCPCSRWYRRPASHWGRPAALRRAPVRRRPATAA